MLKMFGKEIGLLPLVIFAIITGTIAGLFMPEFVVRIFATINGLFSNFLSFAIPLIILGLVISGIADMGKNAGSMLIITIVIAYTSTIFSGILTYFACSLAYPFLISGQTAANVDSTVSMSLAPYFNIAIPPLFDVMTALVLSFIIGIGISSFQGQTLKNFFDEFKAIIEKLISNVIIPFLPIFIFGIFLNMSYSGEAFAIMSVFGKVIVLIILLSVVLLLIQFTIAGAISGINPLIALKNMLPAYMTALGTASSAATIPVTLGQVKKNGVRNDVAEFCVPLCATIHLSGSTMKIVGMALAIMWYDSMPIDFITILGFIFMLGIVMIAAPGVPGGAIMAAIAVLQSILGFSEQNIALMIAVYIAIDSFGTACNVTGDGAISLIVNKFALNKSRNDISKD
jgi:Na+/H+-dicarboxylate symporter